MAESVAVTPPAQPAESFPVLPLLVELCRPGAKLPVSSSIGAAGLDLAHPGPGALRILPGERTTLPTGLKVAVPAGHVGLVCPRSGMAAKQGLTVLNAPGVVDSDYRGEVGVILINLGKEPVQLAPGDRIAQLLIVPVMGISVSQVPALQATVRGDGGFGSTGR